MGQFNELAGAVKSFLKGGGFDSEWVKDSDNKEELKAKIDALKEKVSMKEIREVILATNPDMEGESTAVFVSKVLKPLDVRVTRIARGLPVGSDIEYADSVTLLKSLVGRMEMS